MATLMATKKTKKPAYKPHVSIVDAAQGLYTVQSETYTYVLYLVTVDESGAMTCECTAGTYGRTCKHQKIVQAYVAYRTRPQHIRPAKMTGAAGLLDAFGA